MAYSGIHLQKLKKIAKKIRSGYQVIWLRFKAGTWRMPEHCHVIQRVKNHEKVKITGMMRHVIS
jgi:hypothetical protein